MVLDMVLGYGVLGYGISQSCNKTLFKKLYKAVFVGRKSTAIQMTTPQIAIPASIQDESSHEFRTCGTGSRTKDFHPCGRALELTSEKYEQHKTGFLPLCRECMKRRKREMASIRAQQNRQIASEVKSRLDQYETHCEQCNDRLTSENCQVRYDSGNVRPRCKRCVSTGHLDIRRKSNAKRKEELGEDEFNKRNAGYVSKHREKKKKNSQQNESTI